MSCGCRCVCVRVCVCVFISVDRDNRLNTEVRPKAMYGNASNDLIWDPVRRAMGEAKLFYGF